jgi:hypothetical protein
MQLSHVTAFWLRLAGNILLDLFLYVHMFCSPRCAHEIIRRLILLPLARAAALTVGVTRRFRKLPRHELVCFREKPCTRCAHEIQFCRVYHFCPRYNYTRRFLAGVLRTEGKMLHPLGCKRWDSRFVPLLSSIFRCCCGAVTQVFHEPNIRFLHRNTDDDLPPIGAHTCVTM